LDLLDFLSFLFQQIKRLNETVFPVTYNDRFYKEIVDRSDYSKIAFFNDCVVGAVSCRLEIKDNEKKLYIMTLGKLKILVF
jgi:hypothetical protein